jgi:hypothetical protein
VLMGNFGINSHYLGVIEGLDKSQHVTCGGIIDVSSRFIGLGLQCKFQITAAIEDLCAPEIYRFARALDGCDGIFAGISLCPFSTSPKNINLGSQFYAQIYGLIVFCMT